MCQRLMFQTQSTSCMAFKASSCTIWCQLLIIYRHPCKWYPRSSLSSNAFMKVEETPCGNIAYYDVLIRIITFFLKIAPIHTHYGRYSQYKGCLDTWPLWLASLATITKTGATVGSKSWKLSNTRPEFDSRNTRFPPLSISISNAWYSLLA